ncbi:MAG TPA: aldehyde dehydrogenase family protein, partial [Trebonia sp.]|nr:aldehyde dehydrogenase family protein [Trebonia sp.]
AGDQAAQARDLFRFAADLITAGATAAPAAPGHPGYVAGRPAGVAGLVTSRETPFLAQARAAAPALAAGCTAVLKPDERAPLPAALLAEITAAAGLPDGVLNIVHGSLHPRAPGAQARDALIAHPGVARLWLDVDAGERQQVLLDAAARQKLCPAPAGNAPCLIFADADREQATDSALFGAFALNGQRRTATSTILAELPVYDGLVTRLAQRADRILVGDPADPATQVGALPDTAQRDTLISSVRLGVREGARLAAGGRRPAGLSHGNYLAATVLADVTPAMRMFTEQLRGPVVRVMPFQTEQEAISFANLLNPEAAYIWTAEPGRARRLAADLESASIWVNSHNPQDRLGAPGDEVPLGFYTKSQAVFCPGDDGPTPRFGA